MQEKYWRELLDMFLTTDELKEKHSDLYKNVDLIVKNLELQEKLQVVSEELKKLNNIKERE